VAFRSDAAYTAATLFRGGNPADIPRALELANRIVADLSEEGRLYSTVDSVAAIALLAEMQAARIVGGAGRVTSTGIRRSASPRISALGRPGG
jgi:hypothetical protein